jgi:hypothetical protein
VVVRGWGRVVENRVTAKGHRFQGGDSVLQLDICDGYTAL